MGGGGFVRQGRAPHLLLSIFDILKFGHKVGDACRRLELVRVSVGSFLLKLRDCPAQGFHRGRAS